MIAEINKKYCEKFRKVVVSAICFIYICYIKKDKTFELNDIGSFVLIEMKRVFNLPQPLTTAKRF